MLSQVKEEELFELLHESIIDNKPEFIAVLLVFISNRLDAFLSNERFVKLYKKVLKRNTHIHT